MTRFYCCDTQPVSHVTAAPPVATE